MVAVSLPVGEVERLIGGWEGRLSVAAVNSPSSVVVSGDSDALAGLLVLCGAEGVRARRVEVDYASHSARVERIEAEIRTALEGVTPVRGGVPLFSTAMDAWLDTSVMGGAYWYANLRRTVGFESAVRALAAEGFGPFVEVSPHPVLAVAVEETLEAVGSSVPVIGTLRRDEGGMDRLLMSLGQAWVHGLPVDWSPVFADTGATGVDLPTYPFQHQSYWAMPDPAISGGGLVAAGLGTTGHPLLGAAVEVAETGELLLTGRISLRTHPWLADHTVSDTTLLPGTAFLELALRAGDEAGCALVDELTLTTPLVLPAEGAVHLQVRLGTPDGNGSRTLSLFSRPEHATPWTPHATGHLTP
ncbi:acyltransferase domain-containing protein, partial [Streptomyces clavuligerus]|uniref:acyltransferase domain-containing protein n=1 Tax=Streptomyces clavuligerus TaxID=1901 RepID=UPI0018D12AEF